MRTRTLVAAVAALCATTSAADPKPGHLDTGNTSIYEVNIRQYTPEGTFDAFRAHIPRLSKMGVGVLWLMPIHPIGEANRKGTLGSYYAVKDYTAVNPEFGTDEDFQELVDAAHQAGMLVIIDWVANHTAWDHPWTVTNPERFTKGPDGGFIPPNPGWADVIDLNFDDPGTRAAMADAMMYWVREFGIDGYRCDVADDVPDDFWAPTIEALRTERPVFLLAEADAPGLHEAGFEATYGWRLGSVLLRAAKGEADAGDVRAVIEKQQGELSATDGGFRMHFTCNHDWNSWDGTAVERFGPAWEAATVLTFTLPGMPLIYSGQEAGLDKQLEFFEKDEIAWRPDPAAELYSKLCALKRSQPALRHGTDAGSLEFLATASDDRVVAFRRTAGGNEVIVLANLSAEPAAIGALELDADRTFLGIAGQPASVPPRLEPWGWTVLVAANKP